MRLTAFLAGVFVCAAIFSFSSKVSAEAPQQIALANSVSVSNEYGMKVLEAASEQKTPLPPPEPPKPKEHTVAEGETLSTIATQHGSTWQRVYAKNPNVANPDIIDVGLVVTVPTADEQLAERAIPLPEPVEAVPATPRSSSVAPVAKAKPRPATAKPVAPRGSAGGNTYSAGYCTWYAKSRRPDLPNNLGNADTWVARAAAQGIPTGAAPRAGAIGQRGMHVVYVESVNGDGTVSISEMNREGWNVVSSRTVPANYFQYIY